MGLEGARGKNIVVYGLEIKREIRVLERVILGSSGSERERERERERKRLVARVIMRHRYYRLGF